MGAQNLLVDQQSYAVEQSLGASSSEIYDQAIHILKGNSINSGMLLDVGAGVGHFISALKKETHFSLSAVDLMHTNMPDVRWYVQDLNRNLQFKNETFNVVSCLEVVEHLENPRKLIRDIFRVLEPGGYAVLSTPNNESWRSIMSFVFRDHFVAFTDSSYPAHITAVNQLDLLRMFDEAGFMNIQCFYTNKGVLPKWTSLSWQKVSFGLLNGKRYSDNILFLAQKPFLRPVPDRMRD